MKYYLATLASVIITMPLYAAPPTPPNGISARTTSGGYVEINWSRASDSDGTVVRYELIRNGNAIQVGDVTQYVDSNIASGVRYTYQVAAIDNDGERSVGNNTVSVTTSGSSSGGTISSGSSGGSSGNSSNDSGNNANTADSSQSATALSPLTSCIDTDGDGWGWDGQESCLVSIQNTIDTSAIVCIDSDGDGWGWTGTESCRIALDNIPQISVCIDVDGDGWGWTGTESCIP